MNKKIILVASGVLLLLITAAIAYYKHISSPEYSLGQIKVAFIDRDLPKFKKYVDIKIMIGNILDDILAQNTDKYRGHTAGEKIGEDLSIGIANMMRPKIEELWMRQIGMMVETGEAQEVEGGFGGMWKKKRLNCIQWN